MSANLTSIAKQPQFTTQYINILFKALINFNEYLFSIIFLSALYKTLCNYEWLYFSTRYEFEWNNHQPETLEGMVKIPIPMEKYPPGVFEECLKWNEILKLAQLYIIFFQIIILGLIQKVVKFAQCWWLLI